MPSASIGADVLVGFPGESDEDFEATRKFIADLPFTYLHVFTYSARPGTAAADLPHQIPVPIKKQRNRILRTLIAEKNLAFRRSLIGQRFSAVTLERKDLAGTPALTDNYIPVMIPGEQLRPGLLLDVHITRCNSQCTSATLAHG